MTTIAEQPRRRGPGTRALVLTLVLGLINVFINASTFNALGVALPSMVKDLNWSWTDAGMGYTVLGACCGGSALAPAWLIRRFGVRGSLLGGALVMVLGFLALANAHGVILYLVGAALCGVGYQMMALIPGAHVIAALYPRRGLPMGLYFTFGSLGGVAGPWLVYGLSGPALGGWRLFWVAMAATAAVLGVVSAALAGGPEWLTRQGEATDAYLAAEPTQSRTVGPPRRDFTVAQALATAQFWILVAAYFGHILVGATVAGLGVAHLTQRGVAQTTAISMLSLEALVQTLGRGAAGLAGERLSPYAMLLFALAALAVGSGALALAQDQISMILFAVGSGLGFGLTGLAVTMLLLNYFGRTHNLELFARTCLVGAFSALGPTLGGSLRDATGAFTPVFTAYAVVSAVILLAVLMMRTPKAPPGEPA